MPNGTPPIDQNPIPQLPDGHPRPTRVPDAYPCPECGKTFRTAQATGTHRAAVHGYRRADHEPEGTHPCPHCDRKFTTERGVNTHARLAHDDKPTKQTKRTKRAAANPTSIGSRGDLYELVGWTPTGDPLFRLFSGNGNDDTILYSATDLRKDK